MQQTQPANYMTGPISANRYKMYSVYITMDTWNTKHNILFVIETCTDNNWPWGRTVMNGNRLPKTTFTSQGTTAATRRQSIRMKAEGSQMEKIVLNWMRYPQGVVWGHGFVVLQNECREFIIQILFDHFGKVQTLFDYYTKNIVGQKDRSNIRRSEVKLVTFVIISRRTNDNIVWFSGECTIMFNLITFPVVHSQWWIVPQRELMRPAIYLCRDNN